MPGPNKEPIFVTTPVVGKVRITTGNKIENPTSDFLVSPSGEALKTLVTGGPFGTRIDEFKVFPEGQIDNDVLVVFYYKSDVSAANLMILYAERLNSYDPTTALDPIPISIKPDNGAVIIPVNAVIQVAEFHSPSDDFRRLTVLALGGNF